MRTPRGQESIFGTAFIVAIDADGIAYVVIAPRAGGHIDDLDDPAPDIMSLPVVDLAPVVRQSDGNVHEVGDCLVKSEPHLVGFLKKGQSPLDSFFADPASVSAAIEEAIALSGAAHK